MKLPESLNDIKTNKLIHLVGNEMFALVVHRDDVTVYRNNEDKNYITFKFLLNKDKLREIEESIRLRFKLEDEISEFFNG